MESLRESWSRLRSWAGREAMDRDMDEEMRLVSGAARHAARSDGIQRAS